MSSENVEVSTRKKLRKRSVILKVFSEYCSHTSIHGIGYLGAEDRSLTEKIWWLVVFILSVAACIFLITNTWIKWTENPVMVSFSQSQTSIWEIPFPAVTICPLNKVLQDTYNYTKNYLERDNLTTEAHKRFTDISLICSLMWITEFNGNKTTDEDVINNIKEVAPKMEFTIPYVVWQNKEFEKGIELQELFVPQLTAEGLCFTFNSLSQMDMYTNQLKENVTFIDHKQHTKGWTIEAGYPEHNNISSYPRRTAQDGLLSGLRITLFSDANQKDYLCGEAISGFKIVLHNPAETPRVSQQYILAPLKKQLTIAVEPKLITTSRGLANIPPHTRKCYFSYEKSLRFYKTYTQSNCRIECILNVTKQACGCAPFYLPRDNITAICGYANSFCLDAVKDRILQYDMLTTKNKISAQVKQDREYKIFQNCDCQPSCGKIDYRGETSQTDYHLFKSLKASKLDSGVNEWMEWTQVDIFFKETQFLAMRRSELYGKTDFLANCGGLLGLFMGFSFLSFLEIIYFLTLRVWCKMKNIPDSQDVQT